MARRRKLRKPRSPGGAFGHNRPNKALHPTAVALRFSEFNVSTAAAAGELDRWRRKASSMAPFKQDPEEWQRLDWQFLQNSAITLYFRRAVLDEHEAWFAS